MIPYAECPHFKKCSCNICPLDPFSFEKDRLPDEEKCKAYKPTRFKIGSKYPNLLKYQGLTKREWLGMHMSEAERVKRRKRFLQLGIKRQNASKKGYCEANHTLL